MRFTFYQLVRSQDVYVMRPYITIYEDLIEIRRFA